MSAPRIMKQLSRRGFAIRSSQTLQPHATLSLLPKPFNVCFSTSSSQRRMTQESIHLKSRSNQISSSRQISTSTQRQSAILNPRTDDDGNEMIVDITPRAANRLKEIMKTDNQPDLALRISVESGGCHGFQYLMSLTDMSKVDKADDTVFEGRDGAKVVLDEPSLELLKGSKVDYTMELIGSQFKIVDNPAATSSCGCGTSFDIQV